MRVALNSNHFKWTPARLTGVSFLSAILIGAFFLSLPNATLKDGSADFLDAFFTAVSAVCVTGLSVQDTSTYFTQFGQIVILVLIQLGGLGIMTMSAALPVIFGQNLKVSQRKVFQNLYDNSDYSELKSTLRNILKYTFYIELIGAIGLTLRWYTLSGDFSKSVYLGIFHSISAFCNAGFALFSDSLVGFSDDPIINIIICALIISGGLGFVVLSQVFSPQRRKMNFHAKFVLYVSGIFIILPAVFFFFVEFSSGLIDISIGERVLVSFFQSVTARTAGFNTIDLNLLSNGSLFLICILMFVGGAPGGTAGGIKITTLGILFLSIKSILLGREQIELFGRRITTAQVTKGIGLLAISFALITSFMILLMITEDHGFKEIFFETISAFGTVGLSLGITSDLSSVGKIIICMMMFIGRIGPLSLVFLIGSQTEKVYYRYPEGKLMMG